MSRFKKIISIAGLFLLLVIPAMAGEVDLNNAVFSDFNRILFVKAQQGNVVSEHHMIDEYFGFNAWTSSDNGLFILENAFRGTKSVTNVLANSYCSNGRYQGQKLEGGGFLSPNLNYEGTKIVFNYTDGTHSQTWTPNTTYHIFTVNLDGTGLTQLTDGTYNDIHPAWMPDGRIVFISERRGGYGRCHGRPVPTFTLHTMNADGSGIRCISYHETNEWWPEIDNQGMIVYTRWDYVDRGATHCHSAWITKSDGENARPVVLNYTNMGAATEWGLGNVPLMQMQIRPIAGSNKYVATGASHHWECYGPIILIDPAVEDDDQNTTITKITADNEYPESNGGAYKYGTPYALSENYFLVAYSPNNDNHYSMYAIDSAQNKTLLYDYAARSIQSPIPVRSRTKPLIHFGTTDPGGAPQDGILNLVNVYNSLIPYPTGQTITHLRILEALTKSTPYANNLHISYEANMNTKLVLGTVPVESDGSARFYAPSNRPLLFQALNSSGLAIQSMRSDMYIVNGQKNIYCNGCHEPRWQGSPNPTQRPTAFLRAPSTITPDPILKDDSQQPSEFFSYPRYIRPILNSKCISCHGGSQAPDLRDGTINGDGWYASYNNLKPYIWIVTQKYPGSHNNRTYPRTEPGEFGAYDSALYTRLAGGHGSLTSDQLHAFVLWMDSGIGQYFGGYTDSTTQNNGGIIAPAYH